ncbi:hypothetical protein [uncultured Tateyamaria sp.]|uniref:hypothetical protein n=1 Tax=uncultured Tateyamaria sp. TaxID=455651 RepID=UPI00262E89B7|nr:hypothetical protein [uncultured Tateyamaria sp.]
MMRVALLTMCSCVLAGQAVALSLADCDRVTHASHGGEAAHDDLGEGRVMWQDWWSQEGTATSIAVVDCGPGTALTFRTQEENMGDRVAFNRTEKALAVVTRHEAGARAFATFERMATDLNGIARNIDITTLAAEPCACAALYPELRGDKTEFTLG